MAVGHTIPVVSDPFALHPDVTDPASMRIAFVILLDGDLVMSPEHLGVALMTAVLRRAGFTVRIMEVTPDELDERVEELAAWGPRLVGFTLMSLNVPSSVAFASKLRTHLPDVTVVAGGPAGTYAGEDVLRINPEIDAVIIGEGELAAFHLAQAVYRGTPISECPSVAYRVDGEIVSNPTLPLLHDLDHLPFPARDQFEMHGGVLEYVRVSTSRGCVARCTFCSAPNVGNQVQVGKAWRGRSPESVLTELEHLVHTYGFRTYDFIDSTFEDPDGGPIGKQRITDIANGIIERDLDIFYNCCMRAENWSDDDHELLDLLVKSGLEKVNVGIEAGNETDLRLWDKLATVDDNARMIRLLREHGIYLAMGFIQFHPYSTVDTLVANAEFLRYHGGHNLRRLTERLEVYPGTTIARKLEADGLLADTYHDTLNPYEYHYQDERVGRLAVHFASLYNNEDYFERGVITDQSAVFKFETFNVVVQTFVARIYRKFHQLAGVIDVLEDFKLSLQETRLKMSDFNYSFFMGMLEDVLADRLDPARRRRDIEGVESYFEDQMRHIRTEQLRAGRALQRLGVDMGAIRSISQNDRRATRTYTGGAPCW